MLSTLRWYHAVDDMTTDITLTLTLTLVTGQKTAPEAKTRHVWTPKFDIRKNRLASEITLRNIDYIFFLHSTIRWIASLTFLVIYG